MLGAIKWEKWPEMDQQESLVILFNRYNAFETVERYWVTYGEKLKMISCKSGVLIGGVDVSEGESHQLLQYGIVSLIIYLIS